MDTVSEEKYPLLLLYVEEGGKRSEYPRRVVFADKTRGKNIIQGAATIITQWPGKNILLNKITHNLVIILRIHMHDYRFYICKLIKFYNTCI